MGKIKVRVEKTTNGFSAFAERYSAFTTGSTADEVVANMVESLNLYFEAAGKGKVVSQDDLRFELDLTSIFDVYPIINMKALASRLGMNYTLMSQYATGKKKPSRKQAARIIEGIHHMGRELTELRLVAS